jgi:rhodanese-related sulfurtransferase
VSENLLEITCTETKRLLDTREDLVLLDCRETVEHEIGVIAGAQLLPMSELENRRTELDDKRDAHLVVYCHHGMRSAQVAAWLRQQGFQQAQSMAGGIDQWSVQIDPTVPRY